MVGSRVRPEVGGKGGGRVGQEAAGWKEGEGLDPKWWGGGGGSRVGPKVVEEG